MKFANISNIVIDIDRCLHVKFDISNINRIKLDLPFREEFDLFMV